MRLQFVVGAYQDCLDWRVGLVAIYNQTYASICLLSEKYYCSPDRLISTELSTSVPSVFYDPDMNSGMTIGWYPRVSGQYKIYFKNYSTATANITGGSVVIG